MIKSKFTFWVLLSIAVVLSLLLIPVSAIVNHQSIFNDNLSPIADFVISLFFALFFWLMFVGETIKKCVSIEIDSHQIIKRSFLGIGIKRTFDFDFFDGFVTCDIPSRGGTYEYLYLMKDSKRMVILSQYYHKNYKQLKNAVMNNQIRFLGKEHWSFFNDMKRLFTFK